MTSKTRTNIYIDEQLKDEAKAFLKQYGISLSNGVNLLLQQMVQKKKIPLLDEIELIRPGEEDYKLIEETKDEETVSLDTFMKL
ncbi:MAG: type II toxin-antitoxin system RelB/DinJ family antitoxin [Campylobacterota bacterium]|nr:type II toxin-antitoxin system RelB/DinJ family antitoxin [Campylobacterota bacterium]